MNQRVTIEIRRKREIIQKNKGLLTNEMPGSKATGTRAIGI